MGPGGHRRSEGEEQPEWMSVNVEQGEMMELRGFEDSPEKERNVVVEERKKDNRKKEERQHQQEQHHRQQQQQEATEAGVPTAAQENKESFNFDDFLKIDAIPGLANILADDPSDLAVASGTGGRRQSGGDLPGESRFSKFFKRQTSPQDQGRGGADEARRSSIQEELQQHGQFQQQQQQQQPIIKIPSPGDADSANFYFAPISPAAKTTSRRQQEQKQQQQEHSDEGRNVLMDLIKGRDQGESKF